MRSLLLFFVVSLFSFGAISVSLDAEASPRIALSSSSGMPVVLSPREGGLVGDFSIANVGDEPLVVSRIAIRGDADDIRSPPHVTVRFESGAPTSATIAPGERRTATIRFMPDRSPRMRQAFGHVVVTSTDEAAGEVAVGFRGDVPSPLGAIASHALSLAVAVPFFGAILLLALGGARRARLVSVVVGVLECALVAWMLHCFVPGVTTADGNDGLQLIEHSIWVRPLGVEWFVGLDGANIAVVALVALVAFAGAVASPPTRSPAYHAAYLVLVGALLGAALALDVFVVFTFAEIVIAASFVLVDRWGEGEGDGEGRGVTSAKLALFGWVASALLLFGIVALVAHGDRTFLVDGTTVRHSSSIPDLGRVAFASKRATVLGMPLVKVAYGAFVVAVAIMLPAFPFHVAQIDARAAGSAAVTALLGGAAPAVVTTLALRLLVGVLPEGAQWAQGTLAGCGAVTIAYGAACAWAERDPKRAIAFGAMSQTGYVLLGLAALSPQGIAGALTQVVAGGLTTSLFALTIGALEEKHNRLAGSARGLPLATAAVGLAAFASFGAPLTATFWGELLVTLGTFPTFRVLAIVAMLSRVVLATYALALFRLFCLRRSEAERSPTDLRARDVASLAPLAIAVVALGVWPTPLLAAISGTVHDLVVRIGSSVADPMAALIP
jgi:NADH-quinone oxidoreductase subunit M